MSNERPDSADDGAFSADERRQRRSAEDAKQAAFAARLAQFAPRSGVDVSALQYEAGYRAGLAERRRGVRIAQGFAAAATAAALFLAVSSWINYESFLSERRALLAATSVPAPVEVTPRTAGEEDEASEFASTGEAFEEAPASARRSLRPRSADVIAAGAAMERRYLTPQFGFAKENLQRKDLYDLSTEPVSTTVAEPSDGEGSSSATASPRSPGGPASPWSAWPNSRQIEDLLEQGI